MACAGIALGSFLLAAPSSLFAAGAPPCNLAAASERLLIVQENVLLPEDQKAELELAARKDLAGQIAQCSADEAQWLANSLRSAGEQSQKMRQLFSRFARIIESTRDRARTFEATAKAATSLEEIRATAKALKEWRNNRYLPIRQRAVALLVWQQNDPLIQTAQDRLAQFRSALEELGIASHGKAAVAFRTARENIEEAVRTHLLAKSVLTDTTTLNNPFSFLRTSLQHLQEAYHAFLILHQEINKALAHRVAH